MKTRSLFANDQQKGLLAGLYELPNIEEHLNKKRNNTVLQRDWTHADSHKKNCPQQNTFSATSNGR